MTVGGMAESRRFEAMPTSTTAWMQEVERRTTLKPSVQGGIYSESWVKGILALTRMVFTR